MKKRIIAALCVSAMIIGSLSACGGSAEETTSGGGGETAQEAATEGLADAEASSDPVKLAFVGPLTGDSQEIGEQGLQGAQLAVKQANEAGGVLGGRTIELVSYDDRLNVDEGCALADMICSDESIVGVPFAHGNSTLSLACGPIYQEAGVPSVTVMASHPDVATIGKFVMRNNTTDYYESLNSVQICYNLGCRKIAYIGEETDYGVNSGIETEEAINMLREAGHDDVEFVDSMTYLTTTVDFSAEITRIMNSGADCILISSPYNSAGQFVNQLRKAGCDLPVVGHGNVYDQQFMVIGGEGAEGVVLPTLFDYTSTSPNVVKFVEEFNAEYGENPNFTAALSYDATWQMIEAIEAAGTTDREAVCDKMYEVSFDGVTGTIIYDENHECIAPQVAVKVENGSFVEAKGLVYPSWEEFLDAIA